jgi:hypothetical protein
LKFDTVHRHSDKFAHFFFFKKSSKSENRQKVKKSKGSTLYFLSIWGNFLVIFLAMFFLPKTINSCPLTVKTLIKLLVTACAHSVYFPSWLFRLVCWSVFPQKSYFFSHLFYFFFSFLVSFLQFFYFYLVLELFIDDLEIIVMVCIIL